MGFRKCWRTMPGDVYFLLLLKISREISALVENVVECYFGGDGGIIVYWMLSVQQYRTVQYNTVYSSATM